MFSNTLIHRETINLTPTPCVFDPYLLTYYTMPYTCDITIEGRKVPIKHNIKEIKFLISLINHSYFSYFLTNVNFIVYE